MTGAQERLFSLSRLLPLTPCKGAHSPRPPPDRLVHNSIRETRGCVWPAPAQQPNAGLALSIFAWFWAGPGKEYQWIIVTVRGGLTIQTAGTHKGRVQQSAPRAACGRAAAEHVP